MSESHLFRHFLWNIIVLASVGAVLGSAWFWALGSQQSGLNVVRHHSVYLSFFVILMALATVHLNRKAFALTLIPMFGAIFLFIVVDLTFLRYFKMPLYAIYPHLPIKAGTVSFGSILGYLKGYVAIDIILVALLALVSSTVLTRTMSGRVASRIVSAIAAVAGIAVLNLSNSAQEKATIMLGDAMSEPAISVRHLDAVDRTSAIALAGPAVYEPPTILFVIMESTGKALKASDGVGYLRDELKRLSQVDGWIDFDNAVTNSNATDVSIPSILTGAGTHERLEKLRSMPFVMDLAKFRGYRTALVTSSTLKWANFDKFFDGAQLDERIFAEKSGLPFINDLTVDDNFAFQATSKLLAEPGKLFVMLYTNALHSPFQATSTIPIPESITDRRLRAAYIQEQGFLSLFKALRDARRLDDALVIVVGDHGEYDYKARPIPVRVESFEGGILSPIFMMKLPAELPANLKSALYANLESLVAGVDLAPTISHLLGVRLREGLSYVGRSLLNPVSADRIAISTATNEWRSWPKAAVAISRGRDRLTCDSIKLCQLQLDTGAELLRVRNATPQDELFQAALLDPMVRKNLGKIYRDHFGSP